MVRRGGFGLIEVIAAMVLLSIGVMCVGTAAAFSTQRLRLAENEEDATRAAASVLDSLVAVRAPNSGEADTDRFHIRWVVGGSTAAVVVTSITSPTALSVSFLRTLPAPLDTAPAELQK